jgi:hypothetical protein
VTYFGVTLRNAAAERCAAAQALDSFEKKFTFGTDKLCNAASPMNGVLTRLLSIHVGTNLATSYTAARCEDLKRCSGEEATLWHI